MAFAGENHLIMLIAIIVIPLETQPDDGYILCMKGIKP
jgi:hypothetical protein